MFSCDTMAVCAAHSVYGQNVLAKNSDRPTGEPQPLCYYKGKEYGDGATVTMTHLTIPQVKKTYAVVGARPYWLWGFEMGYNEKGLMIGNEAEGSRMEPDEADGLLGMDMLRLALERAATAKEAIQVITGLLKTYGQKAQASALTKRTYENTFIIVDPKEAWVLETAGREWAAQQVKTVQGVSNCYSIGTDMDMVSENAERIAREKRWLAPGAPFDFGKAYTGRLVSQPMGAQRFRRLNKLLARTEVHSFESLAAILRDHYEDELIAPRFGETSGTFMSICMHMRDWGESETAASLLCRYDDELGIIARYAPAQPCISAFIPVYMTGKLPASMQTAKREYDEQTLWWQMKELGLLVTVDEEAFAPTVRAGLQELENTFSQKALEAETEARALIRKGNRESAMALLDDLTEACTQALYRFAREQNRVLRQSIRASGGLYGRQKEAIEAYVEYARIPPVL